MYHVDMSKLNGKIVERGTTKEALAVSIGIDRCTLHRRIRSNKLQVGDMHKMCEALRLTKAEAVDIFLSE